MEQRGRAGGSLLVRESLGENGELSSQLPFVNLIPTSLQVALVRWVGRFKEPGWFAPPGRALGEEGQGAAAEREVGGGGGAGL